MSRSNYDGYITIFSPEGKLYQVEYAHKAVKNCGVTSIAIQGENCVVVVAQKKVPDKLMKQETVTSLYRITPEVGMCVTGRVADAYRVVSIARKEAGEYVNRTGGACPVSYLAERMGSKAQVGTQRAGIRLLGVTLHLFSMELSDDGKYVPRIYRVEPSGYCLPQYASAAGAKDTEAIHFLEKRQKAAAFGSLKSVDDVAQLGLLCLQTVLNENIKARDVEIAYVQHTPDAARAPTSTEYCLAASDMIETWLTRIAERD